MEGGGEKLELPIMAMKVKLNPMQYYGAYVNYTKTDGETFGNLDNTENLQWRIFYADGEHIYLTAKIPVEVGTSLQDYYNVSRDEAVNRLQYNNASYVNSNYAEWAHDGMTYTEFKNSYNQVRGSNAELNFPVDDENVTVEGIVRVSILSGRQADLYVWAYDSNKGQEYNYYWLASLDADRSDCVIYVGCYSGGHVSRHTFNHVHGIRPLVCLKSNVKLVENGMENGYMTYNISI